MVTEESIYAQRWITPEVSFYYAFPKEPPSYLTSSDRTDWSALNDKQIVAVRTALTFIQSVTGLLFKETSDLMQPNVIAFVGMKARNLKEPGQGEFSPEQGAANCVEGLK
ncbi:MAG: hypothetical protein EBV34_18210, partial [Betaproteobacteria bacterium]|nr:hypothetical protein [Betaproteobacteria bacterium]